MGTRRRAVKRSDGEAGAAPTGLCGVWVGESEPAAEQGRGEVELETVDVEKALRIAHDPELLAAWGGVVVNLVSPGLDGRLRHEVHGVAHSAAAA